MTWINDSLELEEFLSDKKRTEETSNDLDLKVTDKTIDDNIIATHSVYSFDDIEQAQLWIHCFQDVWIKRRGR